MPPHLEIVAVLGRRTSHVTLRGTLFLGPGDGLVPSGPAAVHAVYNTDHACALARVPMAVLYPYCLVCLTSRHVSVMVFSDFSTR